MNEKQAKKKKEAIANHTDDLTWQRAVIHFDGACEPVNPGGIAVASWVIKHGFDDELIDEGAIEVCRGEGATNNVAEWYGLIYALKSLDNREWKYDVEIFGDSKLVIEQILGNYAVKKEHLKKLYDEASLFLSKWAWDAHHVPREENTEADAIGKDHYNKIPKFEGKITAKYKDPATKKQIDYLRGLGVEVSDDLTKGEAGRLIGKHKR